MKRILPSLVALAVLLAFLGAGWYLSQHPERVAQLSSFSFSTPCAKPLGYTVGTIDPRFGLTKDEIIQKLADAAGLWNTAAGKAVLAYTPDDPNAMPVNFVYDTRQQSVVIGQEIDSTEASQSAERTAIDTLQREYLAAQQAYATAVGAFNAASQAYADEVARVNASGGADSATFARLNAEKLALKQKQQALAEQGTQLDAQAAALKSKIAAFNADVRNINHVVDQFNSTVGGDFEEGQYVRDANGTRHIDIYAYKNQTELIHSLAHELGHSLGLGHNANPASIMFPYNKSSVKLSPDDLADLKKACNLPE